MALLLILLHRKTEGGLDLRGIGVSTAKIVIASLVAGILAWVANEAITPFLLPHAKIGALIALLVVGGGACVVYGVLCYLIKVEELWTIREMFRKPKAAPGVAAEPSGVS